MSRFLRRGATAYAQKFLDSRENMPTDYLEEVRLGMELRSLRYWEEYDEGVVRWWQIISAAAIAGQLTAVQFRPSFATNQPPRDSLLLVDELTNQGAIASKWWVETPGFTWWSGCEASRTLAWVPCSRGPHNAGWAFTRSPRTTSSSRGAPGCSWGTHRSPCGRSERA